MVDRGQYSRRRQGRREKHGWLRFDTYRGIHEGALERHPFVIEDNTYFTRISQDNRGVSYSLDGSIACQAGIVVEVTKTLETRTVRGHEQVRGVRYRYNAHQRGGFNILRYDNQHADSPNEFHRHEYDPRDGTERSLTLLERERLPTLIEVVSEVEKLARAARLL